MKKSCYNMAKAGIGKPPLPKTPYALCKMVRVLSSGGFPDAAFAIYSNFSHFAPSVYFNQQRGFIIDHKMALQLRLSVIFAV